MKRSVIAAATLAVALTGAGAVGVAVNAQTPSHSNSTLARNMAKAKTLTINMYTFSPASLTVGPGQRVQVINQDGVEHTVSSLDRKSFSLRVPPNSTGIFKAPTTSGQYAYHCKIHTRMKGILIVK